MLLSHHTPCCAIRGPALLGRARARPPLSGGMQQPPGRHSVTTHRRRRGCSNAPLHVPAGTGCYAGPAAQHEHHEHNHSHSHSHSHYPDSLLTGLFTKLGLVAVAERVSHSSACLWASLVCFVLASLLEVPALAALLPVGQAQTASTALLCVPWVLSGLPQILESACTAASGVLNTHVLMAMAATGTLYMGMPQEGALLLLLFQLSHTLEESFTSRARGNLARLFASVPDKARVVEMNGGQPLLDSQQPRLARTVGIGEHVLVNSGESVPLDGIVVWGAASVSLQHISGESAPLRATYGSEVPAGSVSLEGSLVLQVRAGMEDSTPARIARMAAQAQANKPKLQRTLDTVGVIWSKAVIAATLAALIGLLMGGVPLAGPRGALYRAMGVLTAGSPCAVILVPLAYVCAIATITRKGVLVKSAAAIDALLTCSTVALDKTGTLTSGALTLVNASIASFGTSGTAAADPAALKQTLSSSAVKLSSSAAAAQSASSQSPSSQASPTPSSQLDSALLEERRQSHASAGVSGGDFGKGSRSDMSSNSSLTASDGHQVLLRPLHIPKQGRLAGSRQQSSVDVDSSGSDTESDSERDSVSSFVSSITADSSVGEGSNSNSDVSAGFEQRALQYAVALSRFSNHPVSNAVVAQLGSLVDTQALAVHHVRQVPGSGVQGVCIGGQGAGTSELVSFGSLSFIRSCLPHGSAREQLDRVARAHMASTNTRAQSFLLASVVDGAPESFSWPSSDSAAHATSSAAADAQAAANTNGAGGQHGSTGRSQQQVAVLCFEDEVQPGARRAVQLLRRGTWPHFAKKGKTGQSGSEQSKKGVIMLTGDNSKVAAQVADIVGISHIKSELKPEDKLAYVERFNSEAGGNGRAAATNGLAMVGDGINDAPALAAARVGVAVASTPSDLVAAAADITILNGKGVANLPWLFAIASRTHMIIRQNMTLALGAVVAATLPTVAGVLPLSMAVLMHEGSTVLVALNSLRLLIDPEFESTSAWVFRGGWRSAFSAFKSEGQHSHAHSHDHHEHEHSHSHSPDNHSHAHSHSHNHEDHAHDSHGEHTHSHSHSHGDYKHDSNGKAEHHHHHSHTH